MTKGPSAPTTNPSTQCTLKKLKILPWSSSILSLSLWLWLSILLLQKKKSKEKHKTLPGPRSCCVTLTEELIVNIWNLFHLKNGEKNNRPKRSNWITWWRRSDPRRPISSVASSPTRPNRPVRERWHSSGWVLPVWPGEYPRRVSFFISRLHEKQNGGEFYTTPVAYHPHFTLLFSSFFAPPPPSPPLLPSVEMSAKNWRPSIFLLFSSRCYRFSLGYAPADM